MDMTRAAEILASIQQMLTCSCGSDLTLPKQRPCSHMKCSECNSVCHNCKVRGNLRRKEPLKERLDVGNICSKFQELYSVFKVLHNAENEGATVCNERAALLGESETVLEQEASIHCVATRSSGLQLKVTPTVEVNSNNRESTASSFSRRSSQKISRNSQNTPCNGGSNFLSVEDPAKGTKKEAENSLLLPKDQQSQKVNQTLSAANNLSDAVVPTPESYLHHTRNNQALDLSLSDKTLGLKKPSVFAYQSSWVPLNLSLKSDVENIDDLTGGKNVYRSSLYGWRLKSIAIPSINFHEVFPMQFSCSTNSLLSRSGHVRLESDRIPSNDGFPTPPINMVTEPMEVCSSSSSNKRKTQNTSESQTKMSKAEIVSEDWAAACADEDEFLANCDFDSPARSNGKLESSGNRSLDKERVLVMDESTNNDEEILLQSTPKKLTSPVTNCDGDDSDGSIEFLFQTPDSIARSQNPKAVEPTLSSPCGQGSNESLRSSPSVLQTSAITTRTSKNIERVKNQLSFGSSPPAKLTPAPGTTETRKKPYIHDTSIPEEFFTDTEFFSLSPDRSVVLSQVKNLQTRMPAAANKIASPGPKRTAILSKSASPYRSPLRNNMSSSRCRESLVLCPTRFNRLQMAKLERFSKIFGAKITKDFNDEVTHLILTLEGGNIPQTMKYLLAIAGKKWVVTFNWVEACMQQKRLIPEEAFETSTVDGCDPGVKLSRLSTIPLFAEMRFCVIGSFHSSGATADEWKSLLRKLGAELVDDSDNFTSDVIIVGDTMDICTEYQELYNSKGMITIAWEYVLECTVKYELMPLNQCFVVVPLIPWHELSPLLPSYLVDRHK